MRFSLRIITSGVFNWSRFFRRLFLLITLRYKSLRSEVANLPPSKGTSGLKSGGMTGNTSRIIHSGRVWLWANPCASLSLFDNFLRTCFERVFVIASSNSSTRERRSILASKSRTASAPIPARKLSSPNSSSASRSSCSVSNCASSRGVLPGSVTM